MGIQGIRAAMFRPAGAPGDLHGNFSQMLQAMARAEQAGAQVLLFSRYSLLGATAGDLAITMQQDLCQAARQLAEASGQCLALFSFPLLVDGRLQPAIAGALEGRFVGICLTEGNEKTLPGCLSQVRDAVGAQVPLAGAALFPVPGSDLMLGAGFDAQRLQSLHTKGAQLLALMDASPSVAGLQGFAPLLNLSHDLAVPCLYANAGPAESTTDGVYDGCCAAMHSGRLVAELPPFSQESWLLADLPIVAEPVTPAAPPPGDHRIPYAPPEGPLRASWCREAMEIAAQGLAARVTRIGVQTLVLGLSGGVDSAMALLTCERALQIAGLPPYRLMAWSLPCFGTSGRTRGNAHRLMAALQLQEREIDISASVRQHFQDIGHDGRHDAAFENAQARERTQVLMDLSNMHQGLMVGPGDMSELALGFTTYGGDHMSMYGVNGGLYKTALRLILKEIADTDPRPALRETLIDILDTPISPELLPGGQEKQQTEQLLGGYELNDCILWHLLQGHSMAHTLQALEQAFPEEGGRDALKERMRRFIRRFFAAQFKRSCMPDGPAVLQQSLSPRTGFSMPSDASPAAWLAAIDQA